MNVNEIQNEIFKLQDKKYRDFQAKLIPNINPKTIVGVRTGELRILAKQLFKQNDFSDFLNSLAHKYFEENQLHSFIISEIKDFDSCIFEVNKFLPFIDNWATCDQMLPKVFKEHKDELLEYINIWLFSENTSTYAIRFAIKNLMTYFLGTNFNLAYPNMILKIHSQEYYINMMIAWYFSEGLVKQYNSILPILENKMLEKWTHNKTIQKAIESYRLSKEQKVYLRTLKVYKES